MHDCNIGWVITVSGAGMHFNININININVQTLFAGILSMWGCVVGLLLFCTRSPFERGLVRGKSGAHALPAKHT